MSRKKNSDYVSLYKNCKLIGYFIHDRLFPVINGHIKERDFDSFRVFFKYMCIKELNDVYMHYNGSEMYMKEIIEGKIMEMDVLQEKLKGKYLIENKLLGNLEICKIAIPFRISGIRIYNVKFKEQMFFEIAKKDVTFIDKLLWKYYKWITYEELSENMGLM